MSTQTQSDLEHKRVFLVVHAEERRRKFYTGLIHQHIQNATVYSATDGPEGLFKLENDPPHVLVTDVNLAKVNGLELVEQVLRNPKIGPVSVIITCVIPDTEHFVDEVLQGQVQFLHEIDNGAKFNWCLTRALNRISLGEHSQYSLKFLAEGDVLFKMGDKAESVYIVKSGKMRAIKEKATTPVVLGEILAGEFVGEMSYINHEPRSATVEALADCELIEIPYASVDMTLFSKPSWAQALVKTLSKRLKNTNEALTND